MYTPLHAAPVPGREDFSAQARLLRDIARVEVATKVLAATWPQSTRLWFELHRARALTPTLQPSVRVQ